MLINLVRLFQITKSLYSLFINYIYIYRNLFLKILIYQYLKIRHHRYILYYILIYNHYLLKTHPNNPYYGSNYRYIAIKKEYCYYHYSYYQNTYEHPINLLKNKYSLKSSTLCMVRCQKLSI